jgi:ArsR family transcriptional regulator, virulence genes transcriptional regulator
MSISELEAVIEPAAAVLKAMANPQRLKVLYLLAERELSVTQMETLVGLSQSALSQHLAKLRQDKLVRTRRDRQTIYYALNGRTALIVMTALAELYRSLPAPANSDDGEGEDQDLQANARA